MEGVKTSSQKRLIKLPPQQSATDTSNWDNRNVAAPTLDKITKKRIVRDTVFIKAKSNLDKMLLTPKHVEKLEAQKRPKKASD